MKKTDAVYLYDGTWQGFLCCVFRSFEKREQPSAIMTAGAVQQMLFEPVIINCDKARAKRVSGWLIKQGAGVSGLAKDAFLTCMDQKEVHILHLLHLTHKMGSLAANAMGDVQVALLRKAVFHMRQEAHLLTGFVRFVEHGDVLTATVSPKNQVLPRLAVHFVQRFPSERIIICDKVHEQILWCQDGKWGIVSGKVRFPDTGADEEQWRVLWKRFYDTIGIEGRENHECRRSMMPKRYWKHMTEMENQPEGREQPHFPCEDDGNVLEWDKIGAQVRGLIQKDE